MNELNAPEPWYSPEWFRPDTLSSFEWVMPVFLYLIAIVPILFLVRWLWRYRFNQKLPVALVKKEIKSSPVTLVRFIPDLLLIISMSLMLVALARPQRTNEKVEQKTEGIDIMLAVDISQSMQFEDFNPNRLEAAKVVAQKFIDGRVQDRIGLVVFSGEAFSLAPLTSDYSLLKSYIKDISFDMINNRGTAIGSALGVVINRMRESETKSKICILLSDGENTAGNIDPITAAELASAYGIKVYTIVIGKDGMIPFGKDFFGRTQMIESTVDESTMRQIAEIGGGEFFRVPDNRTLNKVFSLIDQYEKAEITETRFKDTADYYYNYLAWAVVFLLLWLFTKSTFISNVLQD